MIYQLNQYEILIFQSEDKKDFVATILEMPTISGVGETREKALQELQIAFEGAQEIYREQEKDMPPAIKLRKYSGQFRLRIPRELHYRLTRKAMIDNISLNQEAVYCLTKGLNI
ncbi:MAG: toxin-antitoxin system HicB family antitoxin [Candidatus Eremiobacteraeota bacterium]|nr:toxin-antitoxin system HicB family antitoxin [Candidatus Eremiobacteraeota bacterium]